MIVFLIGLIMFLLGFGVACMIIQNHSKPDPDTISRCTWGYTPDEVNELEGLEEKIELKDEEYG